MSARTLASRFAWIGQRRGNRVGPLDSSDLKAFRVIGVILLMVTLAVTVYYALNFDFAAHTTFRGDLRTARGTVTAVESTGFNEPGTRRSRRDDRNEIDAVRYSFVDANRVERQGVSYRPDVRLKVGDSVTVEHPVGRPEVSRIRGFRSAMYNSMPWALAIMGAVGAVLLGVGLFKRESRQTGDD